ncbi:MAG: hypothetical protein K2W96_19760 [Gemmataceae bacterium]|nr:hypothetical protein [Gemmataceae bacterium]
MQVIDFHSIELMRLPVGLVVIGRCGEAGFGIGDVFTEVRFTVHEDDRCVEEGMEAEVRLVLRDINAFDRSLDRIDPGMTAGILLDGQGFDRLAALDLEAGIAVGRWRSLRGIRDAEGR